VLGDAVGEEEVSQHPEHVVGGHAALHPDRQALTRVLIDHGEQAQLAAIVGRLGHEVVVERRLELMAVIRMDRVNVVRKAVSAVVDGLDSSTPRSTTPRAGHSNSMTSTLGPGVDLHVVPRDPHLEAKARQGELVPTRWWPVNPIARKNRGRRA